MRLYTAIRRNKDSERLKMVISQLDNITADEAVRELRTIQDMLRWTTSCFAAAELWYGHGTENPWHEAIHLIFPTLSLPFDISMDVQQARLTSSERRRIIDRVLLRINKQIPVPYLTNRAWFCGHEFYVDERVLVPRSPIAELIIQGFDGILEHPPEHILDMCTGSGCIAIACAYRFPESEVDAVDISSEALAVAEQNIIAHGMCDNVTPIASDLFTDLPEIKYDLIITNPPYVDAEDMDDLPNEYRHEPQLALSAGTDGLELVRRILTCSPSYLKDGGVLICEVGNSMLQLMSRYPDIPFKWLEFKHGGEGVFVLTKQQIIEGQFYFRSF